MKLISHYSGSDARWLVKTFPTDWQKIPYITFIKIRAWLLKPFLSHYTTENEYLAGFIRRFHRKAKIYYNVTPPAITEKIRKTEHEGFNILYYYPKNEYNGKYCRWCYGLDIIEQVEQLSRGSYNFVRFDGSGCLLDVLSITDFYLRPNRHDGESRLRILCEENDIPCYWSQHDPDIEVIKNKIAEAVIDKKYGLSNYSWCGKLQKCDNRICETRFCNYDERNQE